MSMYDMAVGKNPMAAHWLHMLDIAPAAFGRLRDAWLQDDGEHGIRVVVHTRNGGGNRPDYEEVFERMRAHPHYYRDYDCEYDSTYANIEFYIPPSEREGLADFLKKADAAGKRDVVVDNRTQTQRWDAALDRIKDMKP